MPTRVLLADDHALIRQGLKALLETQGFQVVCEASDGQESLRLAAKDKPAVAIIDISMPVMNGLDAAREMTKSSPKTKAILLKHHHEDHNVTEALRSGMNGSLLKNHATTNL